MALTTCRECGHQVSYEAKTCPSCGVSQPWRRGPSASTMVGWVVAGVVVVGVLGAITELSNRRSGETTWTPTQRTAPPPLAARIWNTGTQIAVRNDDEFAWTNCRISINPGLFGGGWSQETDRIESGEIVRGGLLMFTRSGGERFQSAQYVVERVLVACDTPNGQLVYGAVPTPGEPVASTRARSGPTAAAPAVGVPRSRAAYVGDHLIKTYSPIGLGCANQMAGFPDAVFFESSAQAEANGYRLHAVCR